MHESVDFSGQPSEGSHNNDKSYNTIYKQLSRYVWHLFLFEHWNFGHKFPTPSLNKLNKNQEISPVWQCQKLPGLGWLDAISRNFLRHFKNSNLKKSIFFTASLFCRLSALLFQRAEKIRLFLQWLTYDFIVHQAVYLICAVWNRLNFVGRFVVLFY